MYRPRTFCHFITNTVWTRGGNRQPYVKFLQFWMHNWDIFVIVWTSINVSLTKSSHHYGMDGVSCVTYSSSELCLLQQLISARFSSYMNAFISYIIQMMFQWFPSFYVFLCFLPFILNFDINVLPLSENNRLIARDIVKYTLPFRLAFRFVYTFEDRVPFSVLVYYSHL